MCEILGYPKGVFININASTTHLNEYDGAHKDKFHAFAIQLINEQVSVIEDEI